VALALVDHLGDEARRNIAWLRDTYPGANAEGLANVAVRRLLRLAGIRGAIAGFTGPVGMLIDTGAQTWHSARLALHVAAAYGLDPTARERAAELLVLHDLHTTVQAAQAAIDAAEGGGGDPPSRPAARSALAARLSGPAVAAIGPRIAWAGVVGVARRLIPGVGVLVGALADVRGLERTAVRARRYYRLRARMSVQETEAIMQEGVANE
jgi:hypothetical protein